MGGPGRAAGDRGGGAGGRGAWASSGEPGRVSGATVSAVRTATVICTPSGLRMDESPGETPQFPQSVPSAESVGCATPDEYVGRARCVDATRGGTYRSRRGVARPCSNGHSTYEK